MVSLPKEGTSLYLVVAESSVQCILMKLKLTDGPRIRRRWVKRDLQSPSSKLCIRLTTNMSKKLKPNWDNLSENAF